MGNRPLLFVKTPPPFFKEIEEAEKEVQHDVEVFVNEEETIESIEEISENLTEEVPIIEDGELRKRKERLIFLSNPFQQKAYQPLVFIVNDGRKIQGEVLEVDEESAEVVIKTANEGIQPIAISKLDDLLWRGRSFL
ncbi:hypothetical protein ACWV26_03495 [Rummeliibacillus sp. JY-2-4R]